MNTSGAERKNSQLKFVISELVKATPDQQVLDWVAAQSALDLYLSAVTIGEVTRGAERLPDGRRRDALIHWIDEDLQQQFEGRILPFDRHAARVWGRVMGEADRAGRPRAAADAQIAATAILHGLDLVTRNKADFRYMPVTIVDPWNTGS